MHASNEKQEEAAILVFLDSGRISHLQRQNKSK